MASVIKESKKIERKKFFIYSGATAIGIFALIKNPFKLLGRNNDRNNDQSDDKSQMYSGKIKITQNPNSVTRNTGSNTGSNTTKLNNG